MAARPAARGPAALALTLACVASICLAQILLARTLPGLELRRDGDDGGGGLPARRATVSLRARRGAEGESGIDTSGRGVGVSGRGVEDQ